MKNIFGALQFIGSLGLITSLSCTSVSDGDEGMKDPVFEEGSLLSEDPSLDLEPNIVPELDLPSVEVDQGMDTFDTETLSDMSVDGQDMQNFELTEPTADSSDLEAPQGVEDDAIEAGMFDDSQTIPLPTPTPSPVEQGSLNGDATLEGSMMEYIVRPGDTLQKIARQIYGVNRKWISLQKINGITDPNLIKVGDVLRFPVEQETRAFADQLGSVAMDTYIVKSNDSLGKIAKKLYGSSSYWRYIWKLNQKDMKNPHKIEKGQVIYYVSRETLSELGKASRSH